MIAVTSIPKVVWTLWLQGWDRAPALVQACLASWRRCNPGWRVEALDAATLGAHLPADAVAALREKEAPPEALSDRIRIALLDAHGGVWADATAMCARPLDAWLQAHAPQGFFAFDRPGPDRMIASWFLAAAPGNAITPRWRAAVDSYWRDRTERGDYFWFHTLFADCYAADAAFRSAWDATPKLPANHAFHFSPESPALTAPATPEHLTALADPPAPVFKLTHKLSAPRAPGSLLDAIIVYGKRG